ncbi:MAG: glycine--tRNA ligase subunit beta [Desulfobacterales bacterium]
MNSLLIEIGTEEIPAGYIEPALRAMSSSLIRALDDARIVHGEWKTYGTPRRLAVVVSDVADKQESVATEVLGPPEKIGFDSQGTPQVPAIKFAEKIGVPVGKLSVQTTERGNYLCAVKKEKGQPTRRVLKSIVPDVIGSIPFPKTMRWADLNLLFARPIQSLLALLGDAAILFSVDGIRSGRYVWGHPFTHPGKVKIPSPDRYEAVLKTRGVMVDILERKHKIETDIDSAANEIGGTPLANAGLLDTVANLVEYPTIVVGAFDEKFLQLPREVLVTAMEEHQKYFAVVDQHNQLMPYFIAVSNTSAKDMSLVARGNQRVLRARLEDAAFFYRSDLEKSLEDWTTQLKGVLFQASLGSMYEKVERIQVLVKYLADAVSRSGAKQRSSGNEETGLKDDALRAAVLCKADLVSHVVVEFPKLQGTMGRTYALAQGESQTVADAIESHYRPTYSGGPLPESPAAAIVAIADKIDTLCGCFSAGLLPTGTSDPHALRRQSIGIIQIMLDQGFSFPLREVVETSLSAYGRSQGATETVDRVCEFLRNRMSHLLVEEGFSKDVVSAITHVTIDPVAHVWDRVRALEKLKAEPGFAPLAVAFKRVVNIIRKAALAPDRVLRVEPKRFQHETESHLYQVYQSVKDRVEEHLTSGRFEQALLDIASMRDAVDGFFDGVMVMAEDEGQRNNRLALLKDIADLFGLFADFSRIST